jgi:transposase
MEQLPASSRFVGIDVSKDRLDVHVRPSGRAFAVMRNDKGLALLIGDLRDLAPDLIVLEATGGFEITVAAALAAACLPLAVVNPRQIRDFARATGRLAKTDALDAEVIALFAERIRPEPRPIADADSQALGELVARRRQVVEMIGMESNRLRQARTPRVQRTISATLKTLQAQLAELDHEIWNRWTGRHAHLRARSPEGNTGSRPPIASPTSSRPATGRYKGSLEGGTSTAR